MTTAIQVENVSKEYVIGARRQQGETLRDSLAELAKNPFQFFRRNDDMQKFWALKDVSFSVRRGEVLGIVGRNGAGKSTLLKILSRITSPTMGRVRLYGRVGTLLEVGTGFHPELTGRENIFLNGSILGMTRYEIRERFDEIVAFAEIEKFIDMPVKRYSSGMYVRLAFAVAAHLKPEILIIDEVLAVGDAEFQKKCLGKMGSVAKDGRTVLFVSHNLSAVRSFCDRAALFEAGILKAIGESANITHQYLEDMESSRNSDLASRLDRDGSGELKCVKVACLDSSLREVPFIYAGEACYIRLDFIGTETGFRNVKVGIGIDDGDSRRLVTLYSDFTGQSFTIKQKKGSFICAIPRLDLRPDIYSIAVFIGNEFKVFDVVLHAATLEVHDSDFYGSGRLPDKSQGPFLVKHEWSMPANSEAGELTLLAEARARS